jgi:tRNA dimethylallyltransferase
LGYRQVVEFLNGVRSLPETVALIKARTRQYAKRQMTWFRRQLPVQWLSVTPKERTENIIDKLAAKLVQ